MILKTRTQNGKFQVKVDGKWRSRQSWFSHCFPCSRKGHQVPLDYIGKETNEGTLFHSFCPRCGNLGPQEWIGKPRERGDNGHIQLANRRKRQGW